MSSPGIIQQARIVFNTAGRLGENPLVGLALRREQRNRVLQPGWKRNAWVFLLGPLMFIITVAVSVVARNGGLEAMRLDDSEALRIMAMVILVPLALLWLLGGLFRLCRDSLGWYSHIKDAGGAQMLDGLICISPMDDLEVLLAGIRLNAVPIWSRILMAVLVFCACFLLVLPLDRPEIIQQTLVFLPLMVACMFTAGMLGSTCLALYLMLVGLHLRFSLLVPILAFLLAMLQFFVCIFGSVFFAELSNTDSISGDLWPVVLVGFAAGLMVFLGAPMLAFRGRQRNTWLMVVIPLLTPIIGGFLSALWEIGNFGDEEVTVALFGNMMWIYNAMLPFSPFSAPTVMFYGIPLMESWNALAFEFWRWPLMIAIQLCMLFMLFRYALQATRERRTPHA